MLLHTSDKGKPFRAVYGINFFDLVFRLPCLYLTIQHMQSDKGRLMRNTKNTFPAGCKVYGGIFKAYIASSNGSTIHNHETFDMGCCCFCFLLLF